MEQHLVKCADGKWAPAVVVCKHLLDGSSHDWRKVPEEITAPTECDDWLCPVCIDDPLAVPRDDLRVICMHCADARRQDALCRECGVNPRMTRAEAKVAARRNRSGWWRRKPQ